MKIILRIRFGRCGHKRRRILLFIPPYTPTMNPIEEASEKINILLANPSNHGHLLDIVNHCVATIVPTDCDNTYIYINTFSVK